MSWLNKLGILGKWNAGTPVPVDEANPVPVRDANLDVTLSSARDAIKGGKTLADLWSSLQLQRELSESIWTDDTETYFLRRVVIDESAGTFTVSWTDVNGAASAGPGAGARPLSAPDRDLSQSLFTATAGGTGYSSGDILARVLVIDVSAVPPVIVATLWFNISLGTTISAPTAGTYRQDLALTDQELGLRLGASTDAEATGNGTLIAIVKRLRTLLAAGLPSALKSDRLQVDAHVLARYRIADEAAGATAYYGFIANNGDWYIMQEVALSGTYRYANLSNNSTITGGYSGAGADKAWVNRATLTYGYLNTLTGL